MRDHFVTFGQQHVHRVCGQTLDCDTVAVFKAKSSDDGREKAFEIFGSAFCLEYHEPFWDYESIKYFPRGYVYLNI